MFFGVGVDAFVALVDFIADFFGDGRLGAAAARCGGGCQNWDPVDDGDRGLFIVLGDEGGVGDLAGDAAF